MTKKHKPTKQELQEEFHTDLSFEDALRQIVNTPKEEVEKRIEADNQDELSEVEPTDEHTQE